jgi:hypothetical protein
MALIRTARNSYLQWKPLINYEMQDSLKKQVNLISKLNKYRQATMQTLIQE